MTASKNNVQISSANCAGKSESTVTLKICEILPKAPLLLCFCCVVVLCVCVCCGLCVVVVVCVGVVVVGPPDAAGPPDRRTPVRRNTPLPALLQRAQNFVLVFSLNFGGVFFFTSGNRAPPHERVGWRRLHHKGANLTKMLRMPVQTHTPADSSAKFVRLDVS